MSESCCILNKRIHHNVCKFGSTTQWLRQVAQVRLPGFQYRNHETLSYWKSRWSGESDNCRLVAVCQSTTDMWPKYVKYLQLTPMIKMLRPKTHMIPSCWTAEPSSHRLDFRFHSPNVQGFGAATEFRSSFDELLQRSSTVVVCTNPSP